MGLYQLKNHREIFRERLREVLLIKIENEGMRRDKEYQDACLKAQAEGLPKPAKPEKYTQQSLADELGISYTTLNSYINESSKSRKRKETAPQFDQLVLFAQKLNISIDYLMGLTGYRELRPDNNWTYRAMQIEDIERSSAYIIQKDVDARKRERAAGKEFMPQPEDRLDIEQHISDFTG